MKLFTPLLLLTGTFAIAQVPTPVASRSVDVEAYVASMRDRLMIASRDRDPFGLSQTPSTTIFDPEPGPEPTSTPLSEIVAAIEITAVDLSAMEFLVGARSFARGVVIPIRHRGRTIRVQVVQVRADAILFRDVDTGETAERNLEVAPSEEILRDPNHLDVPDGLFPPEGAPLELGESR